MFLVYGGNLKVELRITRYCDAGFETDRDDKKSQTGYVFVLNGGAIDWKISKQITTAISTTEVEYIANEPGVLKGTRHYHRRYHYIRECIKLGEIDL
ncbi:retrotransposon protein, putative, ty1-copia subclass [Tanacetum coccineum]